MGPLPPPRIAAAPYGQRLSLMLPSCDRAACLAIPPLIFTALLTGTAQAEVQEDAARRKRLPSESPCRLIRQVDVQGLSPLRLDGSWVTPVLAGSTGDDAPEGRCLGAEGIGRLAARLQDALIARGWVTTRVLVPPQGLADGVLRLEVLPGRLRQLQGDAPRWGVIPPLVPGQPLNVRDIEQALEALQRVPTARVDLQVEPAPGPGGEPGWSDLRIDWRQDRRWRTTLTLDDSGTRSTGRLQASATLSLDNPLGLNDLFSLGYTAAVGDAEPGARGSRSWSGHYSWPLGRWVASASAVRSRFHQSVAGANQVYVYSGHSDTADLRLARVVHRDTISRTGVQGRGFSRGSANFIEDTEVEAQRRRVGGWELGLTHRRALGSATLDGSLAWRRGTGAFGSRPAPEEAFGEGSSRFTILTSDATWTMPWRAGAHRGQLQLQARAQWNRTPLTPQDRFAIGGRHTVRGFDGGQVLLAERGALVRSEVSLQSPVDPVQAFVALDHGQVGGASAAQLAGRRLTGMAVGVRGSAWRTQWELFVGGPLQKPTAFHAARAIGGFQLLWSY